MIRKIDGEEDLILFLSVDLSARQKLNKNDFQEYLRIFFNETKSKLHLPYIPGSKKGDLFSEEPKDHNIKLKEKMDEITQLNKELG